MSGDYNALKGPKVRNYCQALGKAANLEWTLDMVRLGCIPAGSPVTEPSNHRLMVGWEYYEKIGVAGDTCVVPFIRAKPNASLADFWGPTSSTNVNVTAYPAGSRVTQDALPVHYADEPAPQRSETVKRKTHPEEEGQGEEEEGDDAVQDEKSDGNATAGVSTWKSWAPFSACHKGIFAVLKIDYSGVGGLCVMKVRVHLSSCL
jgi:hypothetical protein